MGFSHFFTRLPCAQYRSLIHMETELVPPVLLCHFSRFRCPPNTSTFFLPTFHMPSPAKVAFVAILSCSSLHSLLVLYPANSSCHQMVTSTCTEDFEHAAAHPTSESSGPTRCSNSLSATLTSSPLCKLALHFCDYRPFPSTPKTFLYLHLRLPLPFFKRRVRTLLWRGRHHPSPGVRRRFYWRPFITHLFPLSLALLQSHFACN